MNHFSLKTYKSLMFFSRSLTASFNESIILSTKLHAVILSFDISSVIGSIQPQQQQQQNELIPPFKSVLLDVYRSRGSFDWVPIIGLD